MRQNTTWSNTNTFPFHKLFQHLFLELNNIPAAHWSENKESIEKLESWRKNTLNINTRPNLVNMYTLHKSPVLETIQEGIQCITLTILPIPFQKTRNALNKGDSYLHKTKRAVLGWTFKTTYTYGKVTITKYSSEQAVQMEKILTRLLHGKLTCHKTKVFVNYYIYTQKRKHCQHMSIFIGLLIIISTCAQDPGH